MPIGAKGFIERPGSAVAVTSGHWTAGAAPFILGGVSSSSPPGDEVLLHGLRLPFASRAECALTALWEALLVKELKVVGPVLLEKTRHNVVCM